MTGRSNQRSRDFENRKYRIQNRSEAELGEANFISKKGLANAMPFFAAPLLGGSCSFLLFNYLLHHHIFVVPNLDYVYANREVTDVDLCLRFGYGLGDELLTVGVAQH